MKVLLISGYAPKELVNDGQLGPSEALLDKPFRRIELARKIRSVLDSD